jgi:DNA-binding NarL/FixJ family response regulator
MFRSGAERVGETSEAPDRDNEQQPDAERIRVMVVDDHPVWRDGLKADLERMGAATVVSEAADGGEAIDRARDAMPEVILMDLRLPTVDGVEATRMIVEESPHVRVLVVSASGEEADVLEAVKAGAAGYLLKSATAEEITDAVQRIHAGEPVFTPSLAGLVLAEFRRVAGKEPTEPVLTVRENEILKLVAKGYSYREIAEKLFISVKTVQNHVQNILTKLQLRRRYELMRYAIHRGLDRGPDPET